MKLRLLRSAIEDLADGQSFYDLQQPGIGDLFFDSLFPTSTPWCHRLAFIRFTSIFTAPWPHGFLMRSITKSSMARLLSFVFWTADAIHAESPTN